MLLLESSGAILLPAWRFDRPAPSIRRRTAIRVIVRGVAQCDERTGITQLEAMLR
jgi:hypothetical protein